MTGRRVWLIRHGESEGNVGLPAVGGQTPLTERGHRQADAVARAFPGPPSLLVVSPFLRARQTAAPTVARFAGIPKQEWPIQEFHYLPGLSVRAVTAAALAPDELAYWQRCDPDERHPDSESFAELLLRARALLDRLAALSDDFVAVFSHGTFLHAVLWTLITGAPAATADGMRAFRVFDAAYTMPNGAITELAYPGPAILGGNTFHLPYPY